MSQPHYIVPLLVEQPTWGGNYIAEFKGISNPALYGKKIGQAFELEANSMVVPRMATQTYGFATATALDKPTYYGETSEMRPLSSILAKPISTLIKFTQAKSNSYQAHVVPGKEFGHWQAKPESWYYFEAGVATLGLAPDCDVAAYRARCVAINEYAKELSTQIKAGTTNITTARENLKAFIDQDHPRRFVNTVGIKKGQIIDLSAGGTHHSWETDPASSLGNIVYEVQVDVKDENCTLRSFDQGNIKDDGSVRPLTIDDYFSALVSSAVENQPETHMATASPYQDGPVEVTKLFDNRFYRTTLLSFSGNYTGAETILDQPFHHLFAKQGTFSVITADGTWEVKTGWSLIIPREVGTYQLHTQDQAVVLKTFV